MLAAHLGDRAGAAPVNELWRAIEQCPVSLVITDAAGKIEFANQSFSRTTGYSLEDCLGKNPRLLKSGHHPRAFYQTMWGEITAGRTWRGQLLNKRRDGERYWEAAVIGPVREEGGQISHFVAVKQEMSPLEQRFRRLLESMAEGYLEGDAHGLVALANPAAATLLGYPGPEALVGRRWDEVVLEAGEGALALRAASGETVRHPGRLSRQPALQVVFGRI